MSPEALDFSRGFVNAHTHIYSGLAPLGMPPPAQPPGTFVEILGRVWWRLDRAIDDVSLRASARLYAAEALLCGTTTLVDHHESPNLIEGSLDIIAEACDGLGIRAVLCYGATERNGGRMEARRGLGECARFIRANTRARIIGVVGIHAPFTVSDDTLAEAGSLCAELGTVLHVHLAEDRVELDDAHARGYAGPLARLQEMNALPRGSILAHGVHLGLEEVLAAARSDCWIVQNPRSNAHNRVGYPAALAASPRVALGTDGFVSDMREETTALFAEAERHGDDLDAAARRPDAGHALIRELFGEVNDACGLGANGRVERLSIDGRLVVRDGALQTGDIDEIRREAREAAADLWRRL